MRSMSVMAILRQLQFVNLYGFPSNPLVHQFSRHTRSLLRMLFRKASDEIHPF
jgi:hypothetical protein